MFPLSEIDLHHIPPSNQEHFCTVNLESPLLYFLCAQAVAKQALLTAGVLATTLSLTVSAAVIGGFGKAQYIVSNQYIRL